jgi:NAD(P)H-flavin reductase
VPALVLTVRQFRRATPRTRVLTLDLGGTPFRFDAGQAVLLGRSGQPIRRAYSIASAPEDACLRGVLEFLVGTDRRGRIPLHLDGLRRGTAVEVEGPFGTFRFPPRVTVSQVLFVAGGTGIAPIRSMIRHAIASGYAGRLTLAYSARTARDFAGLPELRGLARDGHLDLALAATRDAPPSWRGWRGHFTKARLATLVEGSDALCFVCGPSALLARVPKQLLDLGVPARRIRVDRWISRRKETPR